MSTHQYEYQSTRASFRKIGSQRNIYQKYLKQQTTESYLQVQVQIVQFS